MEKERERNIIVLLPLVCPLLWTWPATQACALIWESNLRPFGSRAGAQSTEPHQPGLLVDSYMCPGKGSNPQSWHIGMTLLPTELPGQGSKILLTQLIFVTTCK